MMLSQYNEKVKNKFFTALEQKPSWGKEQIKALYRDAQTETMAELLDEATAEIKNQPSLELVGGGS